MSLGLHLEPPQKPEDSMTRLENSLVSGLEHSLGSNLNSAIPQSMTWASISPLCGQWRCALGPG